MVHMDRYRLAYVLNSYDFERTMVDIRHRVRDSDLTQAIPLRIYRFVLHRHGSIELNFFDAVLFSIRRVKHDFLLWIRHRDPEGV